MIPLKRNKIWKNKNPRVNWLSQSWKFLRFIRICFLCSQRGQKQTVLEFTVSQYFQKEFLNSHQTHIFNIRWIMGSSSPKAPWGNFVIPWEFTSFFNGVLFHLFQTVFHFHFSSMFNKDFTEGGYESITTPAHFIRNRLGVIHVQYGKDAFSHWTSNQLQKSKSLYKP